ncbi:hypothetical protein B0H19DRAFT_1082033 [Mycena capillaripes]|nr:hypothetical protein B0H19DRAFT_1082033 [Mycena capillaripes]
MTEPALFLPFVIPAEETLAKFWKRIAYLTTRTRSPEQGWVCSTEGMVWNSRNPQGCDRCASRGIKCDVDDDQVGCKHINVEKAKTLAINEFFPNKEQFLFVINNCDNRRCRTFPKAANKARKKEAEFIYGRRSAPSAATIPQAPDFSRIEALLPLLPNLSGLYSALMQISGVSDLFFGAMCVPKSIQYARRGFALDACNVVQYGNLAELLPWMRNPSEDLKEDSGKSDFEFAGDWNGVAGRGWTGQN